MRTPVPWIGLAALACMFLLPWLDARGIFDGPHTIRHRPRREVCADCGALWTPGHECAGWWAAAVREPVVPLHQVEPPAPRQLSARLVRPERPALPARRARP
jgi:hypothetical protein